MTAPDRIWTSKCGRALVTHQPRWADDVEYVRADLTAPQSWDDVNDTKHVQFPATPATLSPEVEALLDDMLEHLGGQSPNLCSGGHYIRDLQARIAALRAIGEGK